jgi:hypothetical protein
MHYNGTQTNVQIFFHSVCDMRWKGPTGINAKHNAEAQYRSQHAFSITQGNLPCVASGIRHGMAHRSVGSSRNGLSAPQVAAIDSRKRRMTKSSRQLTWICPPPPKFILNVCCFVWGCVLCLRALGSSERTIHFAWHVAILCQKRSFYICFDGLLFIIYIYGLFNGAVSSSACIASYVT